MKSIKPDEFFKLVSLNSGVSDLETIRNVYYGLVRTISRELKQKQIIKLPDLGEFVLKIHKSRRSVSVNTGQLEILPPKPTIKFKTDTGLKKYFRYLFDEGTVL